MGALHDIDSFCQNIQKGTSHRVYLNKYLMPIAQNYTL